MERVIWKSNINDDMIMNITAPNCPRCGCSNTKFCYYNNYSLTQPRYFCKGCRRYWTKGGSLRNVPVGGACRKPRRCHTKSRRSLHETTTTISTKGGNFSYNNGGETSASNYGHDIINGGNISNNFLANDGSHIDLALVYSNFLGQKPDLIPKTGNNNINYDIPELLEFQNNYPCTTSQQQDGSVDHHDYDNRNHDDEQIFLCGLESFNKQCQEKYCASHGFGIILPPFPGQEAMLLSSSHDQASQVVPPVVGPEVDDDHHHHYQQEDNLFSSCNCWSIFDLPSDDHDIDSTFSGSHGEKI